MGDEREKRGPSCGAQKWQGPRTSQGPWEGSSAASHGSRGREEAAHKEKEEVAHVKKSRGRWDFISEQGGGKNQLRGGGRDRVEGIFLFLFNFFNQKITDIWI
jgi:hypothetical protein